MPDHELDWREWVSFAAAFAVWVTICVVTGDWQLFD
jgi:hypothetical protein